MPVGSSVSPTTEAASQAPATPTPDRTGATAFAGHFYRVFDDRLTWDQAKERCQQLGGYLAVVTSKSENDFLWSLAKTKPYPMYTTVWLGATDIDQEGTWKWLTGEMFTLSEYVGADGGRSENYLNLRLSSERWEDYPAAGETVGQQWYACEWN